MSGPPTRLVVRGRAGPEEIAALVTVLTSGGGAPIEDGYRRWRDQRTNALRASTDRPTEVFARR